MNAINQIIIEGNVIRQPTIRETPNGRKVCMLPIAVNRLFKDSAGKDAEEVGYFDVQTWGETFTDRISKFGYKGRGVRVVGRLKQDRWKDDSGSHSKIYILAEHVDFKPYRKKTNEADSETSAAKSNTQEASDTMSIAEEAAADTTVNTAAPETKTAAAEELNLQAAAAGVAQETVAVF